MNEKGRLENGPVFVYNPHPPNYGLHLIFLDLFLHSCGLVVSQLNIGQETATVQYLCSQF